MIFSDGAHVMLSDSMWSLLYLPRFMFQSLPSDNREGIDCLATNHGQCIFSVGVARWLGMSSEEESLLYILFFCGFDSL